jgi:hypothetical protein
MNIPLSFKEQGCVQQEEGNCLQALPEVLILCSSLLLYLPNMRLVQISNSTAEDFQGKSFEI